MANPRKQKWCLQQKLNIVDILVWTYHWVKSAYVRVRNITFVCILMMGHVFEELRMEAYIKVARYVKKNHVVSGLLFFLYVMQFTSCRNLTTCACRAIQKLKKMNKEGVII